MRSLRPLVVDANILLRAVFGVRARVVIETYSGCTLFFIPDVCVEDARKYIPDISRRRGLDLDVGLAMLDRIVGFIEIVDNGIYEQFREQALERISTRDPDDWPVVATALLLGAPIWTEDKDFFGSGIATWTSDRIETYLHDA